MSTDRKQRIMLLPEELMHKNLLLIHLKHPRTGSDSLCAIDSTNKLFEVVCYVNDVSSWFTGESASDDGSLHFFTVVDPLFFIIPYVAKHGTFHTVEDFLLDEDFPDTHYLSKCCLETEFLNICDSKELTGYKLFSYNEMKTLSWLQEKAKHLTNYVCSKRICLSDASKDSVWDDEKFLLYAYHMVSEYLSDELSKRLFSALELKCNGEVATENS